MQAATEKEGVLKENTGYDISFVEDYKFKCSIIPEAQKAGNAYADDGYYLCK